MRKPILLPLWLGLVLLLCTGSKCSFDFDPAGPDDVVNEVAPILDQAISALNAANADWQAILQDVIQRLPAEVQSTIGTEVNQLLNRGVATVGVELRCNADFLRNRMRQALIRIKSRLLGGQMPPLEPQLCEVVPLAIDMALEPARRNRIEFYGYDFDSADVQVFLQNGVNELNVSQHLNRPTHYHMVLNLAANGVPLRGNSNRLILRWGGREISSIPILQEAPKVCDVSIHEFQPSSVTFVPPHTRGDREYHGNGPDVMAAVQLINEGDRVLARISMQARETRSDWTTAAGTKTVVLYQADPGMRITQLISPATADHSYRDDNHYVDEFPGNGCVQNWKFTGDTGGDDVGETRVEVFFNRVRVELKETSGCVEPRIINRLLELKLLSPQKMQTIQSLQPAVLNPGQ